MTSDQPLDLFLPPVADWFRRTLGEPTPVQRQGWPVIAAGQHALLLAPTGQVLYVSPLKALNNDIYRNLQLPLAGVAETARQMGFKLPAIEIAVRTGDTPTAERLRLLRKPPHALITTPESLHLLLTSKARESLRHVTHCIIDEIHALCPNKRGVFLALLLERLQALNREEFVRIGLSATQRPLDEVARYLGGARCHDQHRLVPRPVSIVDAGLRKNLDLRVVNPVEQFGPLPEKSVWPSIYRLLANEIGRHRSTIIFANNRRSVERITAHLQEYIESGAVAAQEHSVVFPTGDEESVADSPPRLLAVKAHHGSVALEVRQETERALKEGRLQAVVATASLELGIDMGAVDLVCQVESPGSVARALQRVGRAGHLVGQQSKGRLIPKTLPDLLDQAVLAAEMAAGRVEAIQVPVNCLDVLAQQIIAMVAMENWKVDALYRLVRQAYPYRDLTPKALDAVLEMITGRFRFAAAEIPEESPSPRTKPSQQLSALQPRISWDRVHNQLEALPGSQRLALVGGGTIPDTGQYAVVTERGLRLGEVDEEFVYERRVGDAFLLGTNAWRIDRIDTDRVTVRPAEGAPAMIPFWRGESTGRSFDLGQAEGRFLGELAARIDDAGCLDWLQKENFLDVQAARNLRDYVRRQLQRTGAVPTDRVLTIEASRDSLGDWQVVLLSPWGSRINFTLRLALESVLFDRLGYRPQCMHHDNGVLIRLTESEEPILDLLTGLTPENLRSHVLDELGDSALFALRFRQNAARALLMPRGQANKRAPLWLQRLRGRDLLQVARRFPDFPIVAETFRECLHDHLDVPRLEQLLADIQAGRMEVRTFRLEIPSPFAAGMLFVFNMAYQYQYDDTEAEPGSGYARLDQELLDQIVAGSGKELALDPRAIQQVNRRLRGVGQPPRSKAELAEWLRRLGDVAADELEGPMKSFLNELETEGRVQRIHLVKVPQSERWILTEDAPIYEAVFGAEASEHGDRPEQAAKILARFLETHALVGLDDILVRYPFEPAWAKRMLEDWTRSGRVVSVSSPGTPAPLQWSAPVNFQQLQRGTLAIRRREVVACPPTQFADFVARWQKVHSATQGRGTDAAPEVLERLQGVFAPAELWEQAILPARLIEYQPRWLDDLLASGQWSWIGRGGEEIGPCSVAFMPRDRLAERISYAGEVPLKRHEEALLDVLQNRGALYAADLAQQTKLAPVATRAALWSLVRRGLATNDLFDVVRRGEEKPLEAAARQETFSTRRGARSLMRPRGIAARRGVVPEGRWSLIAWGQPDPETAAFAQARLLLERYGIVARELALMDVGLLPWRVLYEVLSRLELTGEVRRGYFVEGLSGAQFALPEAARVLQELASPASHFAPAILLNSLDPANVYGVGAPLDVPLLEGGARPFSRRESNWLVQAAGRPLLLIEQNGKRLTALQSASTEELTSATALLPQLLSRNQKRDYRHKLTVETWNEQPVTTTAGKDLLEPVGFVRDYQAMTLYAVWQ
ncbi:MAG: DEAD/DEAH box helicase [Planctomycetes bacterium]|nr:DEAD/DEAH box helicase [Planctomycetota bacterium]